MVFHRNQEQFERARWRLAFVIPMWIFQVAMLLSLIGIFAYRLAETVEHYQENDKKGKVPLVELVWECTNVGFSSLSLILTIVEASKLMSEVLTPFFMLASHVIKMTCAFANLGLDIVVYTQRSEGNWSTVGLAIDAGLLASMLALGIYSIVTFRRLSAYDDYQPANVKSFGFGHGYSEIEMGVADNFLRASPYNDVPTEYPSQGSRSRSHSAASTLQRPSSFASASGDHPNPLSLHPTRSEEDGRRESYSHERDTQFDSYMARASAVLSKDDVDQAIGEELWGSAGGRTSVERSNSVVGSGVVGGKAIRPHAHEISRATSWTVETAGLEPVPESANETTPISPTRKEEDIVIRGQPAQNEDRAALLGHERKPSDAEDGGEPAVPVLLVPGQGSRGTTTA